MLTVLLDYNIIVLNNKDNKHGYSAEVVFSCMGRTTAQNELKSLRKKNPKKEYQLNYIERY